MTARAHLPARDLALILAIVALWGLSFVAIKVALRELPPFTLAALRFFLAAFPLVFFIKRPRIPWRYVAGVGLYALLFSSGVLAMGLAVFRQNEIKV